MPIDSSSNINDRFKFKKDKKNSIPITQELGKRCSLSANITSVLPVSSAVPATLSQRDPVGPSLSTPSKLPRTMPVPSIISTSTSQFCIVPRHWSPSHPSLSPPTEVPRPDRALSLRHEVSRPAPVSELPESKLSATAPPFVPKLYHQHLYSRDRLDGYIEDLARKFESASSYFDFIQDVRDRGDLHPDVTHLRHPAAHFLSRFQKSGNPAIIESDSWTPSCIKGALKRGPHRSCVNGIKFLREEYADMIEKQQ